MQLSLFYDYERICRSSSFFQKFETLFLAVEAISDEKTLDKSTGRLGYGPICFLKALIYKNAQQIASIPELLRDLESRPLICDMIGFPFGKLPDSSNFYRFLNGHKNSEIQELLYKSNKVLLEKGLITTDIIIADSKPIKACTKENNPKNPNRSLNKNDKIKWNPKATLGYYSYIKQPLGGRKKKFSFFWGYRTHVLVSKEGIPLVEVTRPNNFKDHRVAKTLLRKLCKIYGQKKDRIFLGDAGYDERELYNFIKKNLKSEPYIAINPRNQQKPKTMGPHNRPMCEGNLEMKFAGTCSEPSRTRKKFVCPIAHGSKKEKKRLPRRCPVKHELFCSGKGYGCTKYIDVTNDARSQVPRESYAYKHTFKLRTEVERYFSRMGEREAEQTSHFNYLSIRNQISIAHLTLSLTALAAAILKRPDKIRCFRAFADAA